MTTSLSQEIIKHLHKKTKKISQCEMAIFFNLHWICYKYCFCVMFWFFGHRACGVLPPQFSSVQSSSVQSLSRVRLFTTPWITAHQASLLLLLLLSRFSRVPTLCNRIDGLPPGSAVPGILQARTLEWVAISFSNAWKWKVKVKSLSRVWLFATPWSAAYQAPLSMGFSRQEYWSGVPLPSPFNILINHNGKESKKEYVCVCMCVCVCVCVCIL